MSWDAVKAVIPYAKALVFDGCHKIYLAMDDEEVETFRKYGYGEDDGSELLLVSALPGETDRERHAAALVVLESWWDASCGLRFVNSVRTVEGDPNLGFQPLIEQFEYDHPDGEDDDGGMGWGTT